MYARDCVDDFCAAGAIANYSRILQDGTNNEQHHQLRLGTSKKISDIKKNERIWESLAFLTHIIGDIHQPLHVSRSSDKGGNKFIVNFDLSVPIEDLKYTHHWNLHSISHMSVKVHVYAYECWYANET